MSDFAEKIRVFRAKLNIGQKELGEIFDCAGSAISRWEQGGTIGAAFQRRIEQVIDDYEGKVSSPVVEKALLPKLSRCRSMGLLPSLRAVRS